MKKIAIFGSTGSIGTQALEIIAANPERLSAVALTCRENVRLLERQIEAFHPEIAVVGKESDARELRLKFPGVMILSGREGLITLAGGFDYDVMLNALVGIAGLEPTLAAIENGRRRNAAGRQDLNGSAALDAAFKGDMPADGLDVKGAGLNGQEPVSGIDVEGVVLKGGQRLVDSLDVSNTFKRTGFEIALANKESLVTGGRFVMDAAANAGVPIIPVDSEHSAIFQCLTGNSGNRIERIWLTASGGPFRGWSREQLNGVSVEQALAHPSWSMGAKITVDSATMMNKGFEVIEAGWLFGLSAEQIEVVIQPGSVIHSMVTFADGAVMAQLGVPSMKVPISYALSYPERWEMDVARLAFDEMDGIGLGRPEGAVAQSLNLAYNALREALAGRESAAICLNGANETLVENFLGRRIGFGDIIDTLQHIMARHASRPVKDVEDILVIDRDARREVHTTLQGL